jgi:hypothetical protein
MAVEFDHALPPFKVVFRFILSHDWVTIDRVWIGNRIYWTQNVTTNNYDSLTELHTPEITVTAAHMKSFQSSLAVAW